MTNSDHLINPNQPSVLGISFSKFLLYITLINFAFFMGGSLFNVIQIPSIMEKQEEARMKISEATEKLESANRLLSDAKLTYNLSSNELQEIKNRVLNQSQVIEKEFDKGMLTYLLKSKLFSMAPRYQILVQSILGLLASSALKT